MCCEIYIISPESILYLRIINMDRREKTQFLRNFFKNNTKETPSEADVEKLINMTYYDGKPVIDFDDESKRIEILSILKEVLLSEALGYFFGSKNFNETVLKSALMAGAIKQVELKRDILSRGIPGAKDVFGICPRCGYDKQKRSELQTRSADEGVTIRLTCTRCFFTRLG